MHLYINSESLLSLEQWKPNLSFSGYELIRLSSPYDVCCGYKPSSSGVGEGTFPLSSDNDRWRNIWQLDLVEGSALTSEANGGYQWSAVSYM